MSATRVHLILSIIFLIWSKVRILLTPHWFLTLLVLMGVVLAGVNLLNLQPPPKNYSPWSLGVSIAVAVILAIITWINRLRQRKNKFTNEQLTEMHVQRLAEIQRWLIRRSTTDEAHEMIAAPYGFSNDQKRKSKAIEAFNNWLEKSSSSDTELWFYDSGTSSWEHLCGEDGFAVVKQGKVIDFYMHLMN